MNCVPWFPMACLFMALTATASKQTKREIFKVLKFTTPHEIVESPDRKYIVYVCQQIDSGQEINDYFGWLIDAIKEKGKDAERVLVYCQTVKQCASLFQLFANNLAKCMSSDKSLNPQKRLVEMLHSKTPESVKNTVLDSFRRENGLIRILFATVAFGMGVNTKGVRRCIHVGPPKNLEAYVQESGRCGRDGEQSHAVVLFNAKLCTHVEENMKEYLISEDCRRKLLRHPFDQTTSSLVSPVSHLCCDNCARNCKCNQLGCPPALNLPLDRNQDDKPLIIMRDVSTAQRKILQSLQKSLVTKSMQGDQNERRATVLSWPNFFLEFTKTQIEQLLEHCACIDDVKRCAEIWQHKHAVEVCKIFSEVFDSIIHLNRSEDSDESEEDNDDHEDLSIYFQNDTSFLEMISH